MAKLNNSFILILFVLISSNLKSQNKSSEINSMNTSWVIHSHIYANNKIICLDSTEAFIKNHVQKGLNSKDSLLFRQSGGVEELEFNAKELLNSLKTVKFVFKKDTLLIMDIQSNDILREGIYKYSKAKNILSIKYTDSTIWEEQTIGVLNHMVFIIDGKKGDTIPGILIVPFSEKNKSFKKG